MATDEVRKDLRAAVEARQELGAEYENEIIESFLDKIDARDAQRHSRDLQHRREDQMLEAAGLKRREGSDPGGLALAIVSVTCAIPITAIAADMTGLPGMLISWAGLVGINVAWRANRRSAG